MRKYSHLDKNDRSRIEFMYNRQRLSGSAIAANIGCSQATISRELRRGEYYKKDKLWRDVRAYSADIAQQDYDNKASGKGPALKIANDHNLAAYLEDKMLHHKYSPAAALAKACEEENFKTTISVTTLYRYIDDGLFLNVTNKSLPQGKREKQAYKKIQRISYKRPMNESIEKRPAIVAERQTFGHWEMDTVVSGKGNKSVCLLVLTERLTRLELIVRLKQRTQDEVGKALDRIQRKCKGRFRDIFLSITVDNGGEFLDPAIIEKGNRTKVYYCHPYSSWERGSNENANKLIRRFIPKGADIAKYSEKEIARIQHWINTYPRKILNYRTSEKLFDEQLQHIVA